MDAGVLYSMDGGMIPGKVIYDDTNVEQMASIAPTQIHRNVDLEIVNTDQEGTPVSPTESSIQ